MMQEKRQPDQLDLLAKLIKNRREDRDVKMDEEILSVEGAARALGVSTRTIYTLARKGEIPAMRVGREWRFTRQNIREWVTNGSEADRLKAALGKAKVVGRK